MPYRIGIDVGGTFTHAVAVDAGTLEVVHQAKVPTTHRAGEGVALGVTQALRALLDAGVRPDDVTFIAHSTTQATNALLEGDVSLVGVLGMARGADAFKAKGDTDIGRIEVAPGRFLETVHAFVDSDKADRDTLRAMVTELRGRGAAVIVAAEAFGVDDPARERLALEVCAELGLPATASHEVSGLYGLRTRTKTAAINAAILPIMMRTAEMTAKAVTAAGIIAPLMIMRSDGGVMTIDEVRRRPILTILSGPAAGVAAALMYARISDGIFVEVGGTSSDITCIRDGQAAVRTAVVGGHKLFLRTLDVRTLGLAGGSMVRLGDGTVTAVGPRSAHLAGLPYSCFVAPQPPYTIALVRPLPGDPDDYMVLESATPPRLGERGPGGEGAAITMTCAANAASLVPEGDYAAGDGTAAGAVLSQALGGSPDRAARTVVETGCAPVVRTVEELLADYGVRREHVTLIGGGGGAGAVVPATGALMSLPWRIAENAPVIAAIGVALALVRDSVERTIPNPSREDILRVRREAVDAVVRVGADPATVEVQVEVDAQQQIVRAVATGATELRARASEGPANPEDERRAAAASLGEAPEACREVARAPYFAAWQCTRETRKLFGLLRSSTKPLRLMDRRAVVRLQLSHADAEAVPAAQAGERLHTMLGTHTHYGDAGAELPRVYLAVGPRLVNLSGLLTAEHVLALAEAELEQAPGDEVVVVVVGRA